MKAYGLVAEFDSPTSLMRAAKKLSSEGYQKYDAHSPFPIHGMDAAMNLPQSKLGLIVFGGGIAGFLTALGLQTWVHVIEYPLVIGGKPFFSLPAFVPVMFELTVLLSAFGAVFGMFALNRMPTLNHALHNSDRFAGFSNDKFFISVEATDPKYDAARTKDLLGQLGAKAVEVVEDVS